jgi:hypothetical protein
MRTRQSWQHRLFLLAAHAFPMSTFLMALGGIYSLYCVCTLFPSMWLMLLPRSASHLLHIQVRFFHLFFHSMIFTSNWGSCTAVQVVHAFHGHDFEHHHRLKYDIIDFTMNNKTKRFSRLTMRTGLTYILGHYTDVINDANRTLWVESGTGAMKRCYNTSNSLVQRL